MCSQHYFAPVFKKMTFLDFFMRSVGVLAVVLLAQRQFGQFDTAAQDFNRNILLPIGSFRAFLVGSLTSY